MTITPGESARYVGVGDVRRAAEAAQAAVVAGETLARVLEQIAHGDPLARELAAAARRLVPVPVSRCPAPGAMHVPDQTGQVHLARLSDAAGAVLCEYGRRRPSEPCGEPQFGVPGCTGRGHCAECCALF